MADTTPALASGSPAQHHNPQRSRRMRGMAGIWQGMRGLDVKPKLGGPRSGEPTPNPLARG